MRLAVLVTRGTLVHPLRERVVDKVAQLREAAAVSNREQKTASSEAEATHSLHILVSEDIPPSRSGNILCRRSRPGHQMNRVGDLHCEIARRISNQRSVHCRRCKDEISLTVQVGRASTSPREVGTRSNVGLHRVDGRVRERVAEPLGADDVVKRESGEVLYAREREYAIRQHE